MTLDSIISNLCRSMIARLPGSNQRFMGENLELVCLLQAA